jgi:RND superfamily putative drug exporter
VHVDAIFRAIGKFVVRFRWLVVLFWLAAAVVASVGLPSLASVTQGNNTAFLPASAPSEQAANLAAPFGGPNVVTVPVVAAVSSGTLTARDQAWLASLTTSMGKVPTVVKVQDLGESTPRPTVPGQAAQLVVASNAGQSNQTALTSLVKDLRSAIARAAPPAGLQVHLAGQVAVEVDQQKQSGSTGNAVQGLSFIFILILLFIIFRAFLAPFITLIPAGLSVVIAGPLVGELGHHGLKVSTLSQLLMIVLVLGAGTDYGLFLVFRVRENLRAGQDNKDAVINAITRVGESITFSALTVMAALLSLLFATFQIYSTLGIPLAIGIGVMLLAGLTLLPALLAIFGRAAFWPTKNRVGGTATGVWGKTAARLVRRPAAALIIGVVVFGALSVAVTSYAGGGFGGSLSAPAGSDSASGTALLNKYFPSTAANPTNLVFALSAPAWQDPALIAAATSEIEHSGLFTGVTGPLNPDGGTGLTPAQYTQLHADLGSGQLPAVPPAAVAGKVPAGAYQTYRATSQFVDKAGTTIQFETGLTAGDPSSTAAMNAVPALRAETATVAKTLHATAYGVGGEAPAFYDISSISDSDLVRVIPIAIIVIGVLLALVMRSLVAPLYLIASVAISYFAALGLAVLVFIKIGHQGGITFILPFLLFIFLLALGEDYNILVMTRIREEAHRYSLREAVSRAVGFTGTTVTSAGLVLAGTFAVFAVAGASGSGGSMIREVGFGLAAGVLMDTFVVRTILVPCTVVLLGRWNWWPSKLAVGTADSDAVTAGADSLGMTVTEDGVSRADSPSDSGPASGSASRADDAESPRNT